MITRPPGKDAELVQLAHRSLDVIRANQHASGAYLASPNFPVYRYSWFRDGAFIADAMSRAGDVESADAFFGWCSRVVLERCDQIEGLIARRDAGVEIATTEFLHARYTVDGRESGEEWTDFQLDGYGAWLWALEAHRARHGRSIAGFLPGAILSARYAAAFWDHPSYDWWEEDAENRHISTMAALYGGLRVATGWPEVDSTLRDAFAAAADAIKSEILSAAGPLGYLPKKLGSDATDASLIACATPFRLLSPDDPLMARTISAIETDLCRDGGVYRYRADTYYGGGQWLLLAAFLGWHYAEVGRLEEARAELEWIASKATPNGELPEQVPVDLLEPGSLEPWRNNWGPIATPLLWSHAMYLTLALELGVFDPASLTRP